MVGEKRRLVIPPALGRLGETARALRASSFRSGIPVPAPMSSWESPAPSRILVSPMACRDAVSSLDP